MLFQTFEKISVMVYFKAYQDIIVRNLCVNRDNKSLNCNGQCFLMKKLQNTEERNSTPVIPDTRFSDFVPLEALELSKNVVASEITLFINQEQINQSDWIKDIFHPPNS